MHYLAVRSDRRLDPQHGRLEARFTILQKPRPAGEGEKATLPGVGAGTLIARCRYVRVECAGLGHGGYANLV